MTDWISKIITPLVNALLNPRITAAFAATAGILLYLNSRRLLPVALEPGFLLAAVIVCILCGCLTGINIASSLWASSKGSRNALLGVIEGYWDKRRIEREIPFLTSKERGILAYLLAKNQNMFEVLPDGEQAITLISKGFVVHPARRPMALYRDIAVEIPNHVWEVLVKHRSEFPYEAPKPGETEMHPWRTHWMAR